MVRRFVDAVNAGDELALQQVVEGDLDRVVVLTGDGSELRGEPAADHLVARQRAGERWQVVELEYNPPGGRSTGISFLTDRVASDVGRRRASGRGIVDCPSSSVLLWRIDTR